MSKDEVAQPQPEPQRDKHGISLDKPTQERWDDLKMRDQIGIFAQVERGDSQGQTAVKANRALNEIGEFIHKSNERVSQLEYLGSAAVHIYLARTLDQVVYVSQTQPLLETEERVAGPAFTDLQKSMMTHYSKKTTKVRSGF